MLRRFVWLGPAFVVLAVGLLALNPAPVGVLHDDAIYVILAKSLATGHGYRYLNLPGAPAATHFPPGYPAFLALLWSFAPSFPRSVFVFKVANAVLLSFASIGLTWYLHRQFSIQKTAAAILAALAVLGLPLLFLSGLVLSEPLFLVLVIANLIIAEYFVRSDARPTVLQLVGLGLLCGVATLVRSAGIALLGAVVVRLAMQRRYRDAAVASAATLVLLVPWQLWVSAHGGDVPAALQGAYGPYTDWLMQGIHREGVGLIARTLAMTTGQAVSFIVDTVSPFPNETARLVVGIVLALLVVFGARRAWRFAPATLLFLVFYSALVLVWPVPPVRYVWGIWPLIVLLPALGVVEIIQLRPSHAPARAARGALALSAAVVAGGYALYNVNGYRQRAWLNIPMQGGAMLRPIVMSVRARVDSSATVAVSAEAAAYLYSGRTTVPLYSYEVENFFRPPTVDEASRALEAITKAYKVDVVLASAELQQKAMRVLQQSERSTFTLRDSTAGGLLFVRTSGPVGSLGR